MVDNIEAQGADGGDSWRGRGPALRAGGWGFGWGGGRPAAPRRGGGWGGGVLKEGGDGVAGARQPTGLPPVLIRGGGCGGISAAKALRDAPVRVTVVDRRNHHLFQPMLYQVATAGLNPSDIASPIRS